MKFCIMKQDLCDLQVRVESDRNVVWSYAPTYRYFPLRMQLATSTTLLLALCSAQLHAPICHAKVYSDRFLPASNRANRLVLFT
jgi:hypothetical protein